MIANSLTSFRIFLIFIMSFFLGLPDDPIILDSDRTCTFLSFFSSDIGIFSILFLIAIITDFLDGYIARKYKQNTVFGKLFDPIADKLLVINAFFYLYKKYDSFFDRDINSYPDNKLRSIFLILIMLIIIRDFLITGVRLLASEKNHIIVASWQGKLKTAVTFIIISIILFSSLIFRQQPFIKEYYMKIFMFIIIFLNFFSGLNYIYKNFNIIRKNF